MKLRLFFGCNFVLFFLILGMVACTSDASSPSSETTVATGDSTSASNNSETGNQGGYPINPAYPDNSAESSSGYIAPEDANLELQASPPDPERELPQPTSGGAIVGVLVREIAGEGFLPLTPKGLFLATIVENSNGEPTLIRRGDDAPQAQLLPTGIFVFNNIVPDEYGLVIDVGFSQFLLLDENGDNIIVSVEEGQAIDLGQIFVELPSE